MPERKFSVCGQTVTVSDVNDSYNSLRLWFNQEAINVARGFEEKYDSYGNIDSFVRHIDEAHDYIQELTITALDRIVRKSSVVGNLINLVGVKSLSRHHRANHFHLDEVFQSVEEMYMDIVMTQQQEDEYRELKKLFRSRWTGSTIKGAIKAGAMNLANDAWHGFWDSVDKGFSNAETDRKKSALYKESRRALSAEIYASVYNIHISLCEMLNKPKVILHIECIEPEAREKAAAMVKKFAEMPREEVRKIFPQVMLMNPYDEKLYSVLFSLFGDYDGGLEKIALYFGVDTPFITEAKEALADRLFTENLRQELAKSEQAALSAKAEYERVLKSNGVEDTQSARKNLGTIEERLKVYDEKARIVEGEILATRDKADEARNIIAEVEHFIYRSGYSQSESDAQNALQTIENYESKYPEYIKLIAKRTNSAKEKIREVLRKFDLEARTITYSVRGKAFTRTFSSRTQAEMARKDVEKIESLLQGLDYAESDTDAMEALHRLEDYRPAMKNVFDDYMQDVQEFASAFDLKARTVNYNVRSKTFTRTFDTRKEAEKNRHDLAEIESLLDGLDYYGSEADAKEALQKLEGYTPECRTIFDEYMKDIKGRLSAFDLEARTITYNVRSKTFTKTFSTRLQAENARSEILKIESLLHGLHYAESETDAKEALQKLEEYTPDFQRVFDDYVKDVKDCIALLDIEASTVDFSGVSVVLDREEAEKVKASQELDEIATSWENYKTERTDGALSRIVGMIQKMPSKIRDVYWGFLSAFEKEQENSHQEQEKSLGEQEKSLKELENTMKEATEKVNVSIRIESFLGMAFLVLPVLAGVMFIAKYWQGWNWLGLKGIVTVLIIAWPLRISEVGSPENKSDLSGEFFNALLPLYWAVAILIITLRSWDTYSGLEQVFIAVACTGMISRTASGIRGLKDRKKDIKKEAEENARIAQEDFHKAQANFRIAKENARKTAGYVSDFENLSQQSEKYRDFINSKIDAVNGLVPVVMFDKNTTDPDVIRRAAEMGIAEAQNKLGNMYYSGNGIEQDYAKAVEWFRKAAEQGLAFAQYSLGLMYKHGKGVSVDDAKAVEWYRKAAEQGLADAQNSLGLMYDTGKGVEEDDVKAVEWYRKAAEQGLAFAQYNLGLMYKNGEGVSVDYDEARKWLRKADEQGHDRAKEALRDL